MLSIPKKRDPPGGYPARTRLWALVGILLVAVTLPPIASADTNPRNIALLIDASRSMSIGYHPDRTGRSRFEVLVDRLESMLAQASDGMAVAVLVANRGASVRVLAPVTTAEDAIAVVRTVALWGRTDLPAMIGAATEIGAGVFAGRDFDLIVVTDGEDSSMLIDGAPFVPPSSIALRVILPSHVTPASLPFRAALASGARRAAEPGEPDGQEPAPASRALTDRHASVIRAWSVFAAIVWPLAAIVALLGYLRLLARHRRRVAAVRAHNGRPPTVTLIRRRGMETTTVVAATYPLTLGDDPGGASKAASVTLTATDAGVRMTASGPILLNGVAVNDRILGEGDLLRCGATRYRVDRIESPKRVREPRPTHRRAIIPAVAALAMSVVAILAAVFADRVEPQTPTIVELPPSEPTQYAPADTRPPITPLGSPVMVEPAQRLPDIRLDYLAFHAHPDDEALDFGALVAALSLHGKTGAYVVFTDGESGLDQYPHRQTDGIYPTARLSGRALASVRTDELRRASAWMGFGHVVRLGLSNRPYGSWLDVVPPEWVIREWSAKRDIVASVADLILHFQPRVVLSPNGPSGAREHFEHEAVGIIVDRALRRLDAQGQSPVVLHLRSVDPLQTDAYPRRITMDAWAPVSGSIPRLHQLRALAEHQTQYDATVDGVETRMALAHEYWFVPDHPDQTDPLELALAAIDR